MFSLTLLEHEPADHGVTFEHFRHNFQTIDPETIAKVVTLLMQQPKARKRRKDYGKLKKLLTEPDNGTEQPQLPNA